MAALFENGEHGHFAAPIVKDIIKAYYDKKARLGIENLPGCSEDGRSPGRRSRAPARRSEPGPMPVGN